MVKDQSGIVAEITAALAEKNISLNAFIQKENREGALVPVVITTHEAREKDINEAFNKIISNNAVENSAVKIRIIDEHEESL
jgi:homoserine dehydrogenase